MPSPERPLEGRVALVTGASRGIGRGIALELAAAGAAVGVNYRRDEAAAREVVGLVQAAGGRAVALQASVTELAEVDALADAALEALGPVDLLVCNAGIASRGQSVADTDPAEVQRVVATHAFGAHRLIQRLLPGLRAAPRGDVVVISSSELAAMRANGAPYNMAKAALEALALTLAHEEVGNGVRVNIVAPGLVVTDMGSKLVKAKLGLDDISQLDAAQPLGRVTRPADVARVVRFLACEDAAMVTGQRIVVDGGADASPTG
ncbi:SDR family oxidoreductase [Baekduia soli]|uniref:SDR family oxidoreductase n=1 Tax=Baekduia soli TaxID=496014 RepID=A0A5B8UCW1_9ACTN|nr:SDR family oxidoreductase [Baekduia soli]QEC50521.1 SDR family oxidoreductase [Baekduia soli]